MKQFLLALLGLLFLTNATTQTCVQLPNPSFESEYSRPGKAPDGWINCGFAGETPPDTGPDATFSVPQQPQHGKHFLGLVVRDNDTWESVAQPFKNPLQADSLYQFSVYLARSPLYISISRISEETVNYNMPVILRVWAGMTPCDKVQLIAETKPVIHDTWKPYNFAFTAESDWRYLILEAYYNTNKKYPYCGNLLVDNICYSDN